jgi:protein TonB
MMVERQDVSDMPTYPEHRAVRQRARGIAGFALPLLLIACGGAPAPSEPAPSPAQPAPAAAAAAPEPAAQLSSAALLDEANAAFKAGRLIAPAGDNAIERFLRVRELEPNNLAAQEALIELFPITTAGIESALRRDEVGEAERLLGLLRRGSPDSLAVAQFGRRLEQRRAELSRREAEAAARAALAARGPVPTPSPVLASTAPATGTASGAPAAPSAPARPAPAPASGPAGTAGIAPATTPRGGAVTTPAPGAAPTPAAAASPAPSPAATSSGSYVGPVVATRVAPEYPAQARQRRLQGWVELEFAVDAQGRVSDVRVLRASPERVFDNAAIRSVTRWRFRPATRDGVPTASRATARIDFKLG